MLQSSSSSSDAPVVKRPLPLHPLATSSLPSEHSRPNFNSLPYGQNSLPPLMDSRNAGPYFMNPGMSQMQMLPTSQLSLLLQQSSLVIKRGLLSTRRFVTLAAPRNMNEVQQVFEACFVKNEFEGKFECKKTKSLLLL